MQIQVDEHGFWQGQLGSVRFGCTLDLGELPLADIRQVKQVHGVTLLDDHSYAHETQEADGLVSDTANRVLVVRTADCVPLHVTDGQKIAAVHAGWRGTAQGIVERMASYFDMASVHVVLGPAISGQVYEVDADLYTDWLAREPELEAFLTPAPAGGSKRMLHLREFITAKLTRLGVLPERVTLVPSCTYLKERLPSYRRQGSHAARLLNYIYRTH